MSWGSRLRLATTLIVLAGVAFLGFLLGLDNDQAIALRFLNRETLALPVFWWLYAAFGLGLLAGFALATFNYISGRLAARRAVRAASAR